MNLYMGTELQRGSVGCTVGGKHYVGLKLEELMGFFLTWGKKTYAPSTYRNIRWLVSAHIVPALGEREVVYLTESDIRDFLQQKRECRRKNEIGGLSEPVIRSMSHILGEAFQMVVWDESGGAGLVDAPELRPMRYMLSLGEAEALTKYLAERPDRCGAGFLLSLYSGLQPSELCALRDSDFDLNNDRLVIAGDLSHKREKRVLILSFRLSMILWAVLRNANGDLYFLSGLEDKPLSLRTFKARFKAVVREAGLPNELELPMLRNTFAWMWLLRRKDTEGLARVMGFPSASYYSSFYFDPLLENLNVRLPKCANCLILGESTE